MKKFYVSYVVSLFIAVALLCVGFMMVWNFDRKPASSYTNALTGTGAISLASGADVRDYYYSYLNSTATVCIYNSANTLVSFGSGIAVKDGGFLVTNYHVISKVATSPSAYSIKLNILYNDELVEDVSASLIWYDADLDLAIIRSAQSMPYVPMADRWIDSSNKLRVDDTVWTIGTPITTNLFGTFSRGYISGFEPRTCTSMVNNTYYVHETLIQYTAPISSGSSGGGLFDINGNLVGLNTLGYASSDTTSANDLYFAVPIYPVLKIIDELVLLETDGNQATSYLAPSLGIEVIDKNYNKVSSSSYGYTGDYVYVNSTTNTSLKAQYIIVAVADRTCVSTSDSSYRQINKKYDLEYALLDYSSGDTIKVYYRTSETGNTYSLYFVV